jgi:hypothetical protein
MRVLILVLALGFAVFPTAASGAITVGSDLSSSADVLLSCPTAEPCTGVQTQLPGRQITSPIDGVVVRWRVGDGQGPLTFRLVRDVGGGSFTGVGRSETVTPSTPPSNVGQPPTISTFPTRIPVRARDFGGVDLTPDSALGQRPTGGATIVAFVPTLGDDETRSAQFTASDTEALVNADIEPDADRDGFGDETQDLCSKDASTQGLCGGPCANDRVGTEGNDTLSGTDAGDNIRALGGDDTVTSLNGDDCLFGGAGSDRLTGDTGNDRLEGEDAADFLVGALGDDQLSGGNDADQLDGGLGTDTLSGGDGRDEVVGGDGNDSLTGDGGDDRLTGGPGRDSESGGAGVDHLNGVSGNDRLNGGSGRDFLGGGSNNDVLSGGSGSDVLRGDAGNDRISGGGGNDRIDVGKGRNRASGGAGRDRIGAANGKRDRISCGRGRDRVLADRKDRVSGDCEQVARTRP